MSFNLIHYYSITLKENKEKIDDKTSSLFNFFKIEFFDYKRSVWKKKLVKEFIKKNNEDEFELINIMDKCFKEHYKQYPKGKVMAFKFLEDLKTSYSYYNDEIPVKLKIKGDLGKLSQSLQILHENHIDENLETTLKKFHAILNIKLTYYSWRKFFFENKKI